MYKNKYISELPINEVKEYFDKLRCNTPWTAEQFADFEMCFGITYVHSGLGLKENYVVFGIKEVGEKA